MFLIIEDQVDKLVGHTVLLALFCIEKTDIADTTIPGVDLCQ